MKKIAMFLTATATAALLGGCYFVPPPHHGAAIRRPVPRVHHSYPGPRMRGPRMYSRPVVIPAAPRVIIPAPRTYIYR